MFNNMWFNLAADNLDRSMNFYRDIGFEIMQRPEQEGKMFGFKANSGSPVMVVSRDTFARYIHTNTHGNDVLISLSVNSNDEVDEIAKKIQKAGGKILDQPKERNGFYGLSFEDIDGHYFNIIVMAE